MRQDLHNAEYPSIADFIEAVNLTPRNAKSVPMWREWGFEGERDRSSFFGAGCKTGLDVQAKVRDGWPEGRERMDELRSQIGAIKTRPVSRKRRMVRADAGDVLNIHQVYAGRLDVAWSTPRRQTTQGPQRIDLCANMLCSGGEHYDVLFWRGAAAAVLVELLESAGYMVRLTVIFGGKMHGEDGGEDVSCRVTVKNHGMPFDVSSASSTIMPGFFRALGHAWIASHCVGAMSPSGISVRQGKVEPSEILLSHDIRDHGSALDFINKTIERINLQSRRDSQKKLYGEFFSRRHLT